MFLTFLPPLSYAPWQSQSNTVNNRLDWNCLSFFANEVAPSLPLLALSPSVWQSFLILLFLCSKTTRCASAAAWIWLKRCGCDHLFGNKSGDSAKAWTEIIHFSWTKGDFERNRMRKKRHLFSSDSDLRDDFWSSSQGALVYANKCLQTDPRAPWQHPRGGVMALFHKWKKGATTFCLQRLNLGSRWAVPL